jgi:predicted nucleotidyltransferase
LLPSIVHSAASTNGTLADLAAEWPGRDRRGYHADMGLESLRRHRREILEIAARHGARNVRVFGSVARGDDREDSDVDLLVEIEPGRTLLDVIAFEQDVQQLLGRNVEVLTDGGLSPYLQQRILAEAASL